MSQNTNYYNWTMDDIVFDQRNKDYGGYQMRKMTKRHLRLGGILALVIVAVLVAVAYIPWDTLFPKKEEPKQKITEVNLAEPHHWIRMLHRRHRRRHRHHHNVLLFVLWR